MKYQSSLTTTLAIAFTFGFTLPSQAEVTFDQAGKISVYGDARFRLEADWDSRNSSGGQRADRNRLRTRLRLGLDIKPSDRIRLGFRLRSGSDLSQQSPHITLVDFDNNDTGDADFNLDKWYASFSDGNATIWAGRNGLPFWKQNELFWDDDVTPAGVGLTWKLDNLAINAGYFSLPAGMQAFSGNLAVGQAVYGTKVGDEKNDLTIAGGFLGIDGNPTDSDASLLLDNNGSRDYRTWVVSAQYGTTARERSLKFGFDYIYNSRSYSPADPDPFTAINADETGGIVASISYGSASPGDWLAAYYYADVETFAFSSSYAQDDWMRWGSANETRSTNFSGHEFRLAYGLKDDMNLVARLYVVEANVLRSASATAKEDGNRFRIDLNYKF
ncbi:MAG: putative porin [Woeseia sp.]